MKVKILLLVILVLAGCATSPLISAIKKADLNSAKMLIDQGADPNKISERSTPLIVAVKMERIDLVELLVKNGADVNRGNNRGDPPLMETYGNKNTKVAEYLLKNGADVDARNKNGWTALMYVLDRGGNKNIAKLLIENGADVNAKNKSGLTVLMACLSRVAYARGNDNVNFIKLLIEKGADVNAKTDINWTAINLAARNKNFKAAEVLMENGANMDIYSGRAPKLLTAISLAPQWPWHEWRKKSGRVKQTILAKALKVEQKKIKQDKAKQKAQVNSYEVKNDYRGLKEYTDKNPNAVYYIKNEQLRLALTGPKDLKVGDIRKLVKSRRSEKLITSFIKRVKLPYKEFTLEEVDILISMGLNDNIISAMMDVTTLLLRDEKLRKQQEYFLGVQQKMVNQKARGYSNQRVAANSSPITNKIKSELVQQGVKKIFDLF